MLFFFSKTFLKSEGNLPSHWVLVESECNRASVGLCLTANVNLIIRFFIINTFLEEIRNRRTSIVVIDGPEVRTELDIFFKLPYYSYY